jgi:hypothetical protein
MAYNLQYPPLQIPTLPNLPNLLCGSLQMTAFHHPLSIVTNAFVPTQSSTAS